MNLYELRQKPHLSASAINQYISCSLAYRFNYVDKITREYFPAAFLFGSSIHHALEAFYRSNKQMALSEMQEQFRDAWLIGVEKEPLLQLKKGKTVESMLNDGLGMLQVYVEELPKTHFNVIATEFPFILTLPGVELPIIGAIDLIEEDQDGTIIITDFKTASRAYSSDDIDSHFQLAIYKMAALAMGWADREILLRLDILVNTKEPKLQQVYTTRTEEDQHRIVNKIRGVWDGIQKQVFIANDNPAWKCTGCQFKQQCNAWLLKEAI
jgi:putative RecB family exonuclease